MSPAAAANTVDLHTARISGDCIRNDQSFTRFLMHNSTPHFWAALFAKIGNISFIAEEWVCRAGHKI